MAKINVLKKTVSVAVIMACMGVCAVFLWPEKPVSVETVVAGYRTMKVENTSSGIIEPERTALVLPEVSGIIRDVYVNEGDIVTENQPLYRMDSALLESELAALTGQILLAQEVFADASDHATLQIWRAQQAALEEQIAKCVVRAPFAGQVVAVSVQQGAPASGGVLLGAGGFSVRAFVPDSMADSVRVGQSVSVRRGELTSDGYISAFYASVSEAGVFEATISGLDFDEPDSFPLGLQVDVAITSREYTKVCVPIESLLRGEDAVLCVIDGVAVKCAVELHDQDAYYIAVDGLPEGLQVILHPDGISEGDRVEAIVAAGSGGNEHE